MTSDLTYGSEGYTPSPFHWKRVDVHVQQVFEHAARQRVPHRRKHWLRKQTCPECPQARQRSWSKPLWLTGRFQPLPNFYQEIQNEDRLARDLPALRAGILGLMERQSASMTGHRT